jgi:hypothetical protein
MTHEDAMKSNRYFKKAVRPNTCFASFAPGGPKYASCCLSAANQGLTLVSHLGST